MGPLRRKPKQTTHGGGHPHHSVCLRRPSRAYAFYLSAHGKAPPSLFQDLEAARSAAEMANVPVDFDLGGYPVKVQPSAWGRYRYCVTHELARLGFSPSNHLPVVRIQPTAVALHAARPAGTALR